ncbi:EAL domain-containing protein [Rhizobiaceae bacterium]|nr:EAL domain-containing protein [Rhizobiaceae bacterium]
MLKSLVENARLRVLHDIVVEQLAEPNAGAWRLELATNALDLSPEAAEMLDGDADLEAIFKAFDASAHDELEDALGACMVRGEGFDLTAPLVRDGSPVRIVALPQFEDGALVRIVGTLAPVAPRRSVSAPEMTTPEPEAIAVLEEEPAEQPVAAASLKISEPVEPVEEAAFMSAEATSKNAPVEPDPVVEIEPESEPQSVVADTAPVAETPVPIAATPTPVAKAAPLFGAAAQKAYGPARDEVQGPPASAQTEKATPLPDPAAAQRAVDEEALRETNARNRKRRMALRTDFNRALLSGDVVPHYQPIVALESGRVVGFEALARWQHPIRGPIGPGLFMHVLEDRAICLRLGEVMLAAVLNDLVAWRQAGLAVKISLNMREADLLVSDFVDDLLFELQERHIEPRALVLELAASELNGAAPAQLKAIIADLRDGGVEVTLEDYGRDGTATANGPAISCDMVKVDRCFTADLDGGPQDHARFRAIVESAGVAGSFVIAQGIETRAQARNAAALGCAYGQGFGLGRPADAASATALLSADVSLMDTAGMVSPRTAAI